LNLNNSLLLRICISLLLPLLVHLPITS
jgi:hypothetical protein